MYTQTIIRPNEIARKNPGARETDQWDFAVVAKYLHGRGQRPGGPRGGVRRETECEIERRRTPNTHIIMRTTKNGASKIQEIRETHQRDQAESAKYLRGASDRDVLEMRGEGKEQKRKGANNTCQV